MKVSTDSFRHVTQAVKYDQWQQAAHGPPAERYAGLAQNGWAELVGEKLTDAFRRGPACFDCAFYVGANRFDLGFIEARHHALPLMTS